MLPDLLTENLSVVFCGTGVGSRSAKQEAYYAGCGNKFYCVLYNSGITPIQLIPSDYKELLNYNIGLTDLVKGKSGMDTNFKNEDFDVKSFTRKMEQFKPKIICFNGKEAAKKFLKVDWVNYGLQSFTLNESKLFVAASTSPNAHDHWDEKIWIDLSTLIKKENLV